MEYREGATWVAQPGPARATGAATLATVHDLFCEPVFKNQKLPKTSTKSKISKNRSYRGTIDQQLSQRATWCWAMVFRERRSKLAEFSALFTVQNSVDQVFGHLPLRIWNATLHMKCVTENNKKKFIDLFWTSIVKFGECARKPNQPFRDLGFWPCIWVFTKGFCANVCKIMSNMFMSQLNMINTTN
jgi:hypothetical protein